MDLIHWDVGFALKKLTEQVDKGRFKRLVISADRELFPVSGLRSYLERTTIANLARVRDIYQKALKIVDLYNFEFKSLEKTMPTDICYSFLLPGGGYLQINSEIECIEIRGKEIIYTIPTKENFDHFFEEHPAYSLYSGDKFAHSCSVILNMLSAFYPQVVIPSEKQMTPEEAMLCLLFVKTKNDPKRGADPAILLTLAGLPATERRLLLFQLSEGGYITTGKGFGNNVVITGKGVKLARSVLMTRQIMIVRFSSAKYLSPTDVAGHSVVYYYYVIIPDEQEANLFASP